MSQRLCIILWALVGLSTQVEARQSDPAKYPVVEEIGGEYVLLRSGDYYLPLRIENTCDWQQVVSYWGPIGDVRHAVPAQSTILIHALMDVFVGAFHLTVTHAETREGNKICHNLQRHFSGSVKQVEEDPAGVIPQLGRIDEEGFVRLTQTMTPPASTASVPPTTNAPPAQPQPPVESGTGLDYPVVPVPGANPHGLKPEDVFPPADAPGLVLDGTGFEDAPCTGGECMPLDECTNGSCGDAPPWMPGGLGLGDLGFQAIGAETPRVRIEMTPQRAEAAPRREMNPLGLLARSFDEFLEWWMPTLQAAEETAQSGLQKGLQFLINSQGGSTGKNLTMQVLNFTGRPVDLQGMLTLEPLKKDAQQKVTQAFAKLAGRQIPTRVDLNGYCLEFLKLPPIAGQVLRVAGPEVQKRFAPMKQIMAAANRLTAKGALKPDSNPASYADSIKQWALWTVEQKFDDKKFAEAFLGHARKNVEAAGQKWTKQIEDVVRQRTPNRWQDIVQVLSAARVR